MNIPPDKKVMTLKIHQVVRGSYFCRCQHLPEHVARESKGGIVNENIFLGGHVPDVHSCFLSTSADGFSPKSLLSEQVEVDLS